MKLLFSILSVLVFLVVVGLFVYTEDNNIEAGTIKINNTLLSVEIADTTTEWRTGLMYRESLAENAGMLFIFDRVEHHPFWMKNTLIPLDIIWIGADWTIVDIKENVLPCETNECPSYLPNTASKYVLEVNAGWVERTGTVIGDYVEYLPQTY